jgi:thiamine-monophosphate kinase
MRIDEDAFIGDVCSRLSHGPDLIVPPGDDCAGIRIDSTHVLLMAVDQVVGGIHYFGNDSDTPTPPRLAGRKLLARNLSDIAAMGGVPSHALTSIAWPKSADRDRLDAFMGGVIECAVEYKVDLIGGDLCASQAESASLTIVGKVEEKHLCLRSRAKAGNRIFVTGEFGGSLETGKHLTFAPRLEEGRWLATQGFTQCMIDVSDGLQKDLGRLCHASALSAMIQGDSVPRTPGCDLNQALLDGEDYELAFAVSPENAQDLVSRWPFQTALSDIGYFDSEVPGKVTIDSIAATDQSGYDHFRDNDK